MKLLVTHTKPHLDDIAACWLLKKFHPQLPGAVLKFLPLNPRGGRTYDGAPVDSNPDIIHVGMARGLFDEHRGLKNDSAATLVFSFLKKRGYLPRSPLKRAALAHLVRYVFEEDTGRLKTAAYREFMPPALLSTVSNSPARTTAGFALLEAMFSSALLYVRLERDFKKRRSFRTKWGRGAAIQTAMPGADALAYVRGYVLAVISNPLTGYLSARAQAESAVNLSLAYKRLKALEPRADWYLHHSKKLLICGDAVAPKGVRSRLTLKKFVELLKKS